MAKISFFALGGLDERGKNLYCLEVDKDIYVFDAGTKNPERGILGIDVVIANFDYLKENKNRIKGIFVSKSADECAAAIMYMVKDLNVPIYGSELTCDILRFNFNRFKIRGKDGLLNSIKPRDVIKVGGCKIEVFSTTASMPNTYGYVVHTKDGLIVYTSDYIFDAHANENFATDMQHLGEIVNENKVLLFLSEASTASRMGYTAPNHKMKSYVERAIKEAKGRIILACFDQDLHTINELFDMVRENNPTVGIYGQTLIEVLKSVNRDKKIDLSGINIKPLSEAVKTEKSIIIVTGSGERLYSRLVKIATSNDEMLEVLEDDTIILATPPTPGSELNHANVLDELTRTIAKVVPLSSKKVWTMTASYEDIKLMTSILKPKYFTPIKGLYKDFVCAKAAAIEAGLEENNAILLDNGQAAEFIDGKYKTTIDKLRTSDIYVDGIGVGDIGAVVLNERKQLATSGVVILGVSVDSKTKEITSLIDTQMRGVIYIQDNNDIFKKMQKEVTNIVEKHRDKFKNNEGYELNDVRNEIKSTIGSLIKNETGKTPIILALVNEI